MGIIQTIVYHVVIVEEKHKQSQKYYIRAQEYFRMT
jgi:hypothetical protein